MPVHLADHLSQNRHIPDIFILNPDMSIGETIDELILIAKYSFKTEYQDRIAFLPIPYSLIKHHISTIKLLHL